MTYELTKNFEKELLKFFQWVNHHYLVENDLNQYVKWNKKMLVDFNETPRKKLDGFLKHVFKIYIIKDKKTEEVIDSYIDMISQFKNQKESQKKSKKHTTSTENSTENSTEDSPESSFEYSTEDSPESSFEYSTEDSTEDSSESSFEDSIESFLEDSIEDSIESSLEDFIDPDLVRACPDLCSGLYKTERQDQNYIEDSDIEDSDFNIEDRNQKSNYTRLSRGQHKKEIIINNNLDTSRTWWLDNLIYNTTHLVETFGKPVFTGTENDKHRYEWKFTYKKHTYTIYDWKFKNKTFCDILDCQWFLGGDFDDHIEEVIDILDHTINLSIPVV